MSERVRFATTAECGELWGVSPRTVRRWVERGWIAGVKLGPRTVRVELVEGGERDGVQEEGSREEVRRS